jgi:two-component system chemotaxis sensor kinase CheA
MGDGKVSLILDVQGIASYSGLSTEKMFDFEEEEEKTISQEGQSVLLFDNASVEQFGISLALVSRIDKIKASEVETIGGRDLIKYRSTSLPVIRLEKYINLNEPSEKNVLYVILFNIKGKNIGLIARNIVDTKDLTFNIDTETLKQAGILGSAIIDNRTTLFLDIFELVQMAEPSWFKEREIVKVDEENPVILVVEDSDFFRSHVKNYLSGNGYDVIEAVNGQDALDKLALNRIDLVITDIEMPVMDGYEMTKKIKSDKKYSSLKVIALTSMTGEEDIKKGVDAGIDDYQIKFDRENLLDSVATMLKTTSSRL